MDKSKKGYWTVDGAGVLIYLRLSDKSELQRIEKRTIKEGREIEYFTLLPGGDLRSSTPTLLRHIVEEHLKNEHGIEPVQSHK